MQKKEFIVINDGEDNNKTDYNVSRTTAGIKSSKYISRDIVTTSTSITDSSPVLYNHTYH